MRSLVVGRFQPLHIGHVRMIEYAAGMSERLIIGLGSCNCPQSLENPFSAQEREEMIRESVRAGVPYAVRRIPDFGDNDKWMSWIRDNISFDEVVTNSRNEAEIFLGAGFVVHEVPFFDRQTFSATEVRRRIAEGGDWESLLPAGTKKVIEKIGGLERIRKLAEVKSD